MEIVIDINEDVFTRLFDNGIEDYAIVNDDLFAIAKSIRNGIPLPANPTNGDVIKTMFPDFCHLKGSTDYKEIVLFELKDLKDWWNASYKEVNANGDSN